MTGNINSIQTLGLLDGPGIRVVVFMQGCNLRCAYCHNPETWATNDSIIMTADEIFDKIKRYKTYFKSGGGVTFSGGEPLLQSKFLVKVSFLLKNEGIHIAIDTSGSVLNDDVIKLLSYTDLVILDIKMNDDDEYKKYMGGSFSQTIRFLEKCENMKKDVWLRRVIVPKINDNDESVSKFYDIANRFSCVKKTELLPFKKMCVEKYESLGLDFKLKDYDEMSDEKISDLTNRILRRN